MKQRRRIEITIETRKVTLIRQRHGTPARTWCAECAAEVVMLNPDESAALTGADPRALYRQLEAGRLHFLELTDGGLLICLPSLRTANDAKENSL